MPIVLAKLGKVEFLAVGWWWDGGVVSVFLVITVSHPTFELCCGWGWAWAVTIMVMKVNIIFYSNNRLFDIFAKLLLLMKRYFVIILCFFCHIVKNSYFILWYWLHSNNKSLFGIARFPAILQEISDLKSRFPGS